jgi:hypothetical protein
MHTLVLPQDLIIQKPLKTILKTKSTSCCRKSQLMLLFLSGCISYTSITPLGSGRLHNALLDFDGALAFVFVRHPRIPSRSIRFSPAVPEFISISTCPTRSCTGMTLYTSQRKLCGCLDPMSKSCQGINVLIPCSSHPTNPPPPKENPCFSTNFLFLGFSSTLGIVLGG